MVEAPAESGPEGEGVPRRSGSFAVPGFPGGRQGSPSERFQLRPSRVRAARTTDVMAWGRAGSGQLARRVRGEVGKEAQEQGGSVCVPDGLSVRPFGGWPPR